MTRNTIEGREDPHPPRRWRLRETTSSVILEASEPGSTTWDLIAVIQDDEFRLLRNPITAGQGMILVTYNN